MKPFKTTTTHGLQKLHISPTRAGAQRPGSHHVLTTDMQKQSSLWVQKPRNSYSGTCPCTYVERQAYNGISSAGTSPFVHPLTDSRLTTHQRLSAASPLFWQTKWRKAPQDFPWRANQSTGLFCRGGFSKSTASKTKTPKICTPLVWLSRRWQIPRCRGSSFVGISILPGLIYGPGILYYSDPSKLDSIRT